MAALRWRPSPSSVVPWLAWRWAQLPCGISVWIHGFALQRWLQMMLAVPLCCACLLARQTPDCCTISAQVGELGVVSFGGGGGAMPLHPLERPFTDADGVRVMSQVGGSAKRCKRRLAGTARVPCLFMRRCPCGATVPDAAQSSWAAT